MSYQVRTQTPAGSYSPFYMKQGTYTGALNSAILGNGAITGANVLNNCVGYSQGRMAEQYCEDQGISPQNPFTLFNMDAQNWFTAAINAGYQTGQVPKLGAVGVYASRSNPDRGHVCNVEQYANGRWEITEGHYFHPDPPGHGSWDYSYLNNVNYKPEFIQNNNDWYLIGFIYPFNVTPGPTPGPPLRPMNKLKTWMYSKRIPF